MTTTRELPPLVTPQREARAFFGLRARQIYTVVKQALKEGVLRTALIVILSLVLWAGLYLMFADAFRFLTQTIPHPEDYEGTVEAVFSMFFATLSVMLIFSSALILYGSLFRSQEMAFLMTTPAHPAQVFLYKFQEALVLSSWGFVLLGTPLLLAYGQVAGAPWWYFALLLPFIVAFVYIPVALGGLVCLLIMYWLPRYRVQLLVLAGLAAVVLLGHWIWRMLGGTNADLLTPGWFREMLGRLKLTQGRLLPSWWFGAGVLDAARGLWSESIMFLVVLMANALFLRLLAAQTAGATLRQTFNAAWGPGEARPALLSSFVLLMAKALSLRPRGAHAAVDPLHQAARNANVQDVAPRSARPKLFDRLFAAAMSIFSRPMAMLLLKDIRTFRRDPVQWSQFFIFFVLLALFFGSIQPLTYTMYYAGWIHMVSFLNVTVVGLLMSTFTTRFIFPLISLEGRRFWLLALLPINRDTIIWSKFVFAVAGSLVPCCVLILLSDTVLKVHPWIVLTHQLTCVVLCLGLAGISVGLGARFPNLKENSPARIAAGFGGTLSLVVSTLYIVAVVLLTALPCHFCLGSEHDQAVVLITSRPRLMELLRWWLAAGSAATVVLGVVATVVPLWVGIRAFRRLEF